MKEDLIKKFFRESKQVKLEREQKDSIRGAVLDFMKENPLEKKPSIFIFRPIYASALAVLIIVIAGGFVSIQADSSLPGDTLYPVKIGFNEKVLQVLAFSQKARTDLNIELAERRFQEIEQLAVEGKITDNNQQEINKNLNEKVKDVAQSIDELNKEKNFDSADKIASTFEASVKAHSLVLEKIGKTKQENDKSKERISSLVSDINGAQTSVSKEIGARKTIDVQNKVAQNRLEEAEKNISELKDLIEKDKEKIGLKDILQAEDNLNLAEQKINEGKNRIEGDSKDYNGAISSFQQALIIAKQSKYLIKAKNNLRVNFDIRIENKDEN
jgi:hypothetical protein